MAGGLAAAAALLGLVLAGALVRAAVRGVPAEDSPRPLSSSDLAAAPRQAASGSRAAGLTVYLVDGGRLVPVKRAGDGSPGAALDALAAGPTTAEAERGLRSAVAPGTSVRVTRRSGDLVVVDLSKELAEAEPGEQVLAVGQLVCTATAADGVGRVAFTLQGRPIDAPAGDGTLRTRPLGRADFDCP